MPKRIAPLTSAQLANLKPDPTKTIELRDGACPGLRLRVTPFGTKSWSLMVMDSTGKQKRFSIHGASGLADARKKADELRGQVRQGYDPTAQKRAAKLRTKAAKMGEGTLEALIDAYYSTGPGAGHRTKDEQQKRIKSVFAKLLATPTEMLDEATMQLAVDGFETKSSGASAVKYISRLLKWAHKRGLTPTGIRLERPVDLSPVKQRLLSSDELKAVLPHLGVDPYHRAVRMLLFTAVRLTELTGAVWREFDLASGLWTVPGERRKDTRGTETRRYTPAADHVIPLPTQAVALLKAIKAEAKKTGANDKVFVGKQGGALCNWDRALKFLAEDTGVDGWSAHALRRTTATIVGELGFAPHVASVVLGHKALKQENGGGQVIVGSLTERYNKSRYADEHRKALQDAADFFDQLTKPKK